MEDAIFHGARVNEQYDYTASTYGLDHPTVLWTLGEHYLYSRDKEWLLHAWPHMEKAIAWIDKQREATRRSRRPRIWPAAGIVARRQLGLGQVVLHQQLRLGRHRPRRARPGRHRPSRGGAYAERGRTPTAWNCALRSCARRREAPLTQMRDGTYVPYVPVEPNQRFRRFGPSARRILQALWKARHPDAAPGGHPRGALRPDHPAQPGRVRRRRAHRRLDPGRLGGQRHADQRHGA